MSDRTPNFDTTPADTSIDEALGGPEAIDAAEAGTGFDALGLQPALRRAVADAGYTTPSEVQARSIPLALAGGDLRVCAGTGSGKTAAFVLPALQRILLGREADGRRERKQAEGPRVLVLAPTRELAIQVAQAASTYGRHVPGLRVATVVGGVPYGAQLAAFRQSLDLLVATPGRLLDHLGSGAARLGRVGMLVLDEADRMLDMGFIDDITAIAEALPAERQTVMVSATFAGEPGRLAQRLLRDPQCVDVASHTDRHANIEQRLHWADDHAHKNALLDHLLTDRDVEQAVVFTSTQRDADWLADRLAEMGHPVASLHGGHPQGRRNRVLQGLRRQHLKVLVATDVAARGIDVPSITHVINYGLPMKAEDYVHRIGRTGRAGRSGLAVTLAERMDAGMVRRIQQFTTQEIPVAAIAGLEPRRPVPQLHPARPARGMGPGRGPRHAPREGGWAPRGDAVGRHDGAVAPERRDARPQGPRGPRHDPRFDAPADRPAQGHGGPARGPRADAPWDRAPRGGAFDRAPRGEAPFDRAPRGEAAFDRAPRGDGAFHRGPRGDAPFDRAPRPAWRDDARGAAPAGRPNAAFDRPAGAPQRPAGPRGADRGPGERREFGRGPAGGDRRGPAKRSFGR